MTNVSDMVLGSNLPIPDPTHLTTRQLLREIGTLKEIIFTKLESSNVEHALIQSVIETRLDGMDKATVLLQSTSDKLPARIDEKIQSLHGVSDEKFSSIQVQFKERDDRSKADQTQNKVSVDAALQAAKEAVSEQNKSSALAIAKSEASTMKQIEQLQQLFAKGIEGLDDKINDAKNRLTRVEGTSEGKTVADTSHQMSSSFIVTIISAIIAFSSVAFAIVMAIRK